MSTEIQKHQPQQISMSIPDMALAVAQSGAFGRLNQAQAVSLMLLAESEGIHPFRGVQEYHLMKQGGVTMKSETMLAKFQQSGGSVVWKKLTDMEVVAIFHHPTSPEPLELNWTIDMAKRAGLLKSDVWSKYPRAMLRNRVVSEGVRTIYPAVILGVYTPEEASSFSSGEIVDITPQQITQPQPNKFINGLMIETGISDEVELLKQASICMDDPNFNWPPANKENAPKWREIADKIKACLSPPPTVDTETGEVVEGEVVEEETPW